jgi:hypothetical protein
VGFGVELLFLFKEVVLILKFVNDFTNQELPPSVQDVLRSGFVVALLLGLKLLELIG